jgi:pimeloyl-ACP methyl ester carboxylesterase
MSIRRAFCEGHLQPWHAQPSRPKLAVDRLGGISMRNLVSAIGALALALVAGRAEAQSNPVYMTLGPAKATLYRPDSGPAPHVGVVVMHRTANYLNHPACTELSRRGFMVLCMNSRFENNEVAVSFERLPLDVKEGVAFLRKQAGIAKVLLFGHSGGGPLMSLYQAVAEKGPAYCKGPNKLVSCGDDLADLPKADGIIFADAHPSNAILVLRALNPSVANEDNPPSAGPVAELDPYDTRNGFNPNGPSRYSPEFQARYFAAQAARMNRLVDRAQDTMARIAAGSYPYSDNDIMIIPRGGPQGAGPGASAYLWITDPTIGAVMSTSRPQKLLKNDGQIESGAPITSVALADPSNAKRNLAFDTGTKVLSLRSFLSANAIRAKNAIDDIDYCSSNNSTVCAVQSISVPVLFAAMGAYYFIRDNERLFDLSASQDKDFVVIEGATHSFTPCVPCEPTKGAYSNTMKNLFDYAADWANKRF